MNTFTRIINRLKPAFEGMAKARVNSVLLGMGREQVEGYGYSFDALQLGPSAWPWRKTPGGMAKENELVAPVYRLQTSGNIQSNGSVLAADNTDKTIRQIDVEQNAA